MNRPSDLVAIPPLARTVIYYALALAFAVVSPLTGFGRIEPLYLVVLGGVSGVFFGVAGSNVTANTKPVVVEEPDATVMARGYHSGVSAPVEGTNGYHSGVSKPDNDKG